MFGGGGPCGAARVGPRAGWGASHGVVGGLVTEAYGPITEPVGDDTVIEGWSAPVHEGDEVWLVDEDGERALYRVMAVHPSPLGSADYSVVRVAGDRGVSGADR